MPPNNHATPVSDSDRAARAAFREHCRTVGGAALVERHGLHPRTVERMERSRRDIPPGLAKALADECRELRLVERAVIFERWAAECEARP